MLLKLIPDDTKIPFMRIRKIVFAISLIASIAALGLFAVKGMNYGIDFEGGTMIEIQTKEGPADLASIRARLGDLGLGEVQVQEFGKADDVLIRVVRQEGGDAAQQAAVEKIKDAFGEEVNYRRVEVVGPRVSGELARAGTMAVGASLIAILIYIWFRFEWQYGLGAIIATMHDVIMTIGLFALLQIEFNLTSIAAVLTIVGYSLNDTVVVYDRIREMRRKYKKMPLTELIDLSINQTLTRTTMTSLTTLIALIALFIFGGEVIRSFTIAMIFGVAIGTYSSIFIASPVLIIFGLQRTGENAPASEPKQA
ncbi:Protein translocase subunit SecF [Hartmannibacter diazotrophicus]|uniref:Protein-export membrane protein SecF n=1 Tax=Hartmannibacter diazotrophicus TaxID=1482074 RepID=A0A2C9D4B3_9HYPH|nr:protein translocase subunit SecF [Hartmannibacter diazotrophicus]SON55152.1 Protein translocase subunit SecF [Hartmannibacter diazotrophicus]